MFNIFKKKSDNQEKLTGRVFQISGMHCGSCAMNIDAELEDLPGVSEASTSYKQGQVVVQADDSVTDQQIMTAISNLGYEATAQK